TYQWTLDGNATGTNGPSLTVNTASLSIGAHTIDVVITGSCGSVTNTATLTVNQLTSATGLSNATECIGTDANFSTTPSGTAPFTYQWTLDGNATGTNGPSLTVNTASLSIGAHTIDVVITGSCGSLTNSATLTVNPLTPPTALRNATVCIGADANFSTTASGTAPF